jgi:hypothetical protein
VSGGGCVGQGHGGRGSPRCSIVDEVADGRRRGNVLEVMEDGTHRGVLSWMRWLMGGGVATFRSGVGPPVVAVPLASFCGRRERQRGEL